MLPTETTPIFGIAMDCNDMPDDFFEMDWGCVREDFPYLTKGEDIDDYYICIGIAVDGNPEKVDFLLYKETIRRFCLKYKIPLKEDNFGFYSIITRDD